MVAAVGAMLCALCDPVPAVTWSAPGAVRWAVSGRLAADSTDRSLAGPGLDPGGDLTRGDLTRGDLVRGDLVANRFLTARAGVVGSGPILVVTDPENGFTQFVPEILKTEGLPELARTNAANLDAELLRGHQWVILGDTTLTRAQVRTLTAWVRGGGTLIAFRPRAALAGLLGLGPSAGTLAEGYLRVDTSRAPGRGLTAETMQYHGAADLRHAAPGTRIVAGLYRDAVTATGYPAVTLRPVGQGIAAAFTYDLARAVVGLRQGNRELAATGRAGRDPADPGPTRSYNLFQDGWLDRTKVHIPQADEQQRLMVNLIGAGQLPLPRLWQLPQRYKAAVVLTGDGHPGALAQARFEQMRSFDPPGCRVKEWTCYRGSAYLYLGAMNNEVAKTYVAAGFELALHVDTDCQDNNPADLERYYATQLAGFAHAYPSVPAPLSHRTHCVAYSDWDTQPKTERAHGIRLDTNYYYWPESWVNDRPGLFTGSGFPMRFADHDGRPIDVYQAVTQLTDESGQSYPRHIDTLLDNALGPTGYYAVVTANLHLDKQTTVPLAQAVLESARRHGVPVVSSRQMLDWLDAREASRLEAIGYPAGRMRFSLVDPAHNLSVMVPAETGAGRALTRIERDGRPVPYQVDTIKGVRYAFLTSAAAGTYTVSYAPAAR